MRILILALSGTLLCSPSFADKEPDISRLPAPVQQRIKEWKGEGDLKKVKTRKQKDGTTIYEVEYKERGDSQLLVLAGDGRVISETEGKAKGKGKAKGRDKDKKDNKGPKKAEEEDDRDENSANPALERSTAPASSSTPTTSPAPPTRPAPTVNRPQTSSPREPRQGTVRTSPARTNTVARPASTATRPVLDRRPGETRYIYWDNLPEPVRRMGLAQQAELGAVNAKLLRVQRKAGKTIYHIPYEKGSVSIDENGIIVANSNEHGGPMNLVKWDDLPEAVKKAALAAGEVNANTVTYQTKNSRSLYHILYARENVISYSQDGKVQDPATYWR